MDTESTKRFIEAMAMDEPLPPLSKPSSSQANNNTVHALVGAVGQIHGHVVIMGEVSDNALQVVLATTPQRKVA